MQARAPLAVVLAAAALGATAAPARAPRAVVYDVSTTPGRSGNLVFHVHPAGLRLVDTSSWSVRTVDPAASTLFADGDLLVTRVPEGGRGAGVLRGYALDGRLLYHVPFRRLTL